MAACFYHPLEISKQVNLDLLKSFFANTLSNRTRVILKGFKGEKKRSRIGAGMMIAEYEADVDPGHGKAY